MLSCRHQTRALGWGAEITSLRQSDVWLGSGAHVRCYGKGRKERCTPLARHTVRVLTAWIKEQGKAGQKILFPSTRGGSLSADSVQYLVSKYTAAARKNCPSLSQKHMSPHVLRHTAAMEMLQAELLNQDVKTNALGRVRPINVHEMMDYVRAYLRITQARPTVVKNYFCERHVRYAAS